MFPNTTEETKVNVKCFVIFKVIKKMLAKCLNINARVSDGVTAIAAERDRGVRFEGPTRDPNCSSPFENQGCRTPPERPVTWSTPLNGGAPEGNPFSQGDGAPHQSWGGPQVHRMVDPPSSAHLPLEPTSALIPMRR